MNSSVSEGIKPRGVVDLSKIQDVRPASGIINRPNSIQVCFLWRAGCPLQLQQQGQQQQLHCHVMVLPFVRLCLPLPSSNPLCAERCLVVQHPSLFLFNVHQSRLNAHP